MAGGFGTDGGMIGLIYRQQAVAVMVLWVGGLVVLTNLWLISYLVPLIGVVLIMYAIAWRKWRIAGIGVLLLAVNPATIRFPFLWLLPVDIAAISLFLPISNLIGGIALIWHTTRLRWLMGGAVGLLALTLWGHTSSAQLLIR